MKNIYVLKAILHLKKYHYLSYISSDYDLERGQHIPNKALARYLARSNADYDENFLDYKKRAMFRKRGKNLFYFHFHTTKKNKLTEVHMWGIQYVMTKNHFLVLFTHERLGWFIRKTIKNLFFFSSHSFWTYIIIIWEKMKKTEKKIWSCKVLFFHIHPWLLLKMYAHMHVIMSVWKPRLVRTLFFRF